MKRIFVRLRPFSGRTLLFTLFLGLILTIVIWTFFTSDVTKAKQCFKLKPNHISDRSISISFFEDVLESKKRPTPGKSIFFHETSCGSDGLVHLNAR